MSLFIVTLGFTLAISSKWAYSYFGLSSFEQIVYHIKVPLEGTNTVSYTHLTLPTILRV